MSESPENEPVRHVRPFWQPWLGGTLLGFAVFWWTAQGGRPFELPSLGSLVWVIPAALGALIGVQAAKAIGFTWRWLAAAFCAFVLVWIFAIAFVMLVSPGGF